MTDNKLTVLDCTLRDGGYHNNWNYPPELVSSYLDAMGTARVDAIEIGFRSLTKSGFAGAHAYTTDDYLESLTLPRHMLVGVMINAKEILAHDGGVDDAIRKLFKDASEAPVDFVRIACHFTELDRAGPIARFLKDKGYIVCVQMMQAGGKSDEELSNAARSVAGWNAVDTLYFADSLGGMDADDVRNAVRAIRREWKGALGIHTHDNMGRALDNCMTAIDEGVSWVDGTVLGMGRGPGNVRTEYILVELAKREGAGYYPDAVFPLVIQEFEKLRKRYGWGPNLLYYLSGMYGIHPTYVQELLSDERYETHHIIAALECLKNEQSASFNRQKLQQAVLGAQDSSEGSWSVEGWVQGRDMLIVAPGPGSLEHREGICRFIDRENPVVVCLNANSSFPAEKVSAYAACHKTRLLLDFDKLRLLKKPVIMPLDATPSEIRRDLIDMHIFDYGMKVEDGVFAAGKNGCVIPSMLVAAYTFALGAAGGAKRILLAGFDGFGRADPKQAEMNRVLEKYSSMENSVPLLAVTPTTYPVAQSSIYSPSL